MKYIHFPSKLSFLKTNLLIKIASCSSFFIPFIPKCLMLTPSKVYRTRLGTEEATAPDIKMYKTQSPSFRELTVSQNLRTDDIDPQITRI